MSVPARYVNQLYARATCLERLGRVAEARDAYVEALQCDVSVPQAPRAALKLAQLLVADGRRTAARNVLADVLQQWPNRPVLHAELATILVDLDEPDAARRHYEKAVELDPDDSHAHSGLATLLWRAGEHERARQHGRKGYDGKAHERPYRGQGQPISLLLVYSAAGGGAPIEQYAHDHIFRNWILIPEFVDANVELPPHDLVFNCIGDADLCGVALDAAEKIFSRTRAPILNAPWVVRQTTRQGNSERLGKLPGVRTARVEQLPRAQIAPEQYPVLLRAPGFHLGRNFVKVDRAEDLPAALASLPGDDLLVIEYVDTSRDGKFRKYRAMFVDGHVYPLHLAVSADWKVHYFSAQMAGHPEHQAEDAAYLQDMTAAIGAPAVEALQRIRQEVGLDYGGIDFGLDADGNVVVFESNATMFFDKPGQEGAAYRTEPFARVREAVTRMLMTRAKVSLPC